MSRNNGSTDAAAIVYGVGLTVNHATLTATKTALCSIQWMLGIAAAVTSCIAITALKLSYHGTLYIANTASGKMCAYFCPAPKPLMIEERKFDGDLNGWDDAEVLQDLSPK